MTIRRLGVFGHDNAARGQFVSRLVTACNGDWDIAEELWEEAVWRFLETVDARKRLETAEELASTHLAILIVMLGW